MGCDKKNIYQPRAGWRLFFSRLCFANVLLAVWLWLGAGNIQEWITHHSVWRGVHLLALLSSAVLIYFIGLWLAGVRPRHILIPQRQLA